MFAVLVAAFLAAPVAAPQEKEKELPEAAKKELKKFEGVWKAVKAVTNGNEETPMNDGNDVFIEFKGRKFLLNNEELFEVAAVDPSTDPRVIDFKAVVELSGRITKGAVYEGIYKFDGDTLVIALHLGESKNRPAKFESAKDSGVVLVTLEQKKP